MADFSDFRMQYAAEIQEGSFAGTLLPVPEEPGEALRMLAACESGTRSAAVRSAADERAGSGAGLRQGYLLLADSDRILQLALMERLPSVGWRHGGNCAETFHGAGYIIEEPGELETDSYIKIWQRMTGRPWTILQTQRSIVRELTLQDLDALYDLYRDPEARRFLPPLSEDRGLEREQLRAYIRQIYGLYGFGYWAVTDRTGRLVGRGGFEAWQKGKPYISCGYGMAPEVRGQGLATEVVGAILDYGHSSLGFERIGIETEASNTASVRLCRRLGLQAAGRISCSGREALLFLS